MSSSNYPPGVGPHTYGAPWNDVLVDFKVQLCSKNPLEFEDIKDYFDDILSPSILTEDEQYHTIVIGGISVQGPKYDYGDGDKIADIKSEFMFGPIDWKFEIEWETLKLI
mgnify:CR=1 FL=1